MSFYENEHIAENYLSQVEEILIDRYHITETDARAAVIESDLKAAIEVCPYIAMPFFSAFRAVIVLPLRGFR